MQNPGISIIIPTYGRAEYLKDLIASIRVSAPQSAYELVVISSDSPESEKARWLSQQKDINLISADTRKEWQLRKGSLYYYTNLGIKKSKRDWVFVGNDDMHFDKDWYREFAHLISDPGNSNVGMVIISTHLGKVKYGSRIVKIGKTKKGDGNWKDLYLSDLSIIRRDALEEMGLFDEKMDWFGSGVDNSLAVEFLTDKDTIISEKVKVEHFITDENRTRNMGREFEDFNYLINKWNKWCKLNNCQYIWDPGVRPYTLVNRARSYLGKQARVLRHYGKYFLSIICKLR